MTQWAWTLLGIGPTDDVRAIRSAYAAELKSFDVDAEHARFARLLEARDVALRLARSMPLPAESEPPRMAESGISLQPEPLSDAAHPDLEPSPNSAVHEATDAHYSALLACLSAPEDWHLPDAATSEAMLRHFRAILADPRMQQISFRAVAEQQFLHILSTTTPRCDPLLHEAIDAFGWRQHRGQLNQPQIIDSLLLYADGVVTRRRAYESAEQFRQQLENPSHEHHCAWQELNKSANLPFASRRVTVRQVRDLLVTLNEYFSPLLHRLDQDRVQFWDNKIHKREQLKGKIVGISVLLFFLAMVGAALFAPKTPQAPQPTPFPTFAASFVGLGKFEVDVAPALRITMPGVNTASLKAANPSLYEALQKRWGDARDANLPPEDFSLSTVKWLRSQFGGNLERAQRADIDAYRRIELKRLRLLETSSDTACALYLSGLSPPPTSSPEDEHQLALLEAKLLQITPYKARPPAPATRTFAIPGEVVHRIQLETGLPPEQLAAALKRNGPARAKCRVRMALIEAALNTSGKKGLELLRAM